MYARGGVVVVVVGTVVVVVVVVVVDVVEVVVVVEVVEVVVVVVDVVVEDVPPPPPPPTEMIRAYSTRVAPRAPFHRDQAVTPRTEEVSACRCPGWRGAFVPRLTIPTSVRGA
jgi:hypothetical protein